MTWWLVLYLIGAAGMAMNASTVIEEDPDLKGWKAFAVGAIAVAAWPAVAFAMILSALSDR